MSACGNTAAIGMLKSGNNGEVSVSADKSVLTSCELGLRATIDFQILSLPAHDPVFLNAMEGVELELHLPSRCSFCSPGERISTISSGATIR